MTEFNIRDYEGSRVLIKRSASGSIYEGEIVEVAPTTDFFKLKREGYEHSTWEPFKEWVIVDILGETPTKIIKIEEITDTLKDPFKGLFDVCDEFSYEGYQPKMCFCVGPEKCGDSSCPIAQNHKRWQKHDWINDPFPFHKVLMSL
jgi:hypothetical protein